MIMINQHQHFYLQMRKVGWGGRERETERYDVSDDVSDDVSVRVQQTINARTIVAAIQQKKNNFLF